MAADLLTRVRAHVVAWMVEWAIIEGWLEKDVKDLMDVVEGAFDMDFEEAEKLMDEKCLPPCVLFKHHRDLMKRVENLEASSS